MFSKEFDGGALMLTGANSAAGLRSIPIRYLILDEIDGYPLSVDNEGDPVMIADVPAHEQNLSLCWGKTKN